MRSGESFPAGIPHPSLSPPGDPGEGKPGVGKVENWLDKKIHDSIMNEHSFVSLEFYRNSFFYDSPSPPPSPPFAGERGRVRGLNWFCFPILLG
jgi:hypothetical protein